MSEANKAAFRGADSSVVELAADGPAGTDENGGPGLAARLEARLGRPLKAAERMILDAPSRPVKVEPLSTPEEQTPEELPAEGVLGEDLLARIEAKLGRPLGVQERAILSRPLAKEPSLSYLAYQILSELRSTREKLLLPASSALGIPDTNGQPSRPWADLLIALIPIPLVFSSLAQSGVLKLWLSGLFAGTLIQSALVIAAELRLKQKVDTGLRDISLIMRAIEADPDLLEIREHVPPPWSWLFFSGRYTGLKDYVRLLSANLDWYLGPPRLLLRWSWITGPLGAAALLTAIALWVFSPSTPGATNWLIGLAGFFAVIQAVRHESSRRAYFIDKLIELLRRP